MEEASSSPWWEKHHSKRSLIKHTCTWREKLIVLWTLNRQAKIFLRISNRLVQVHELRVQLQKLRVQIHEYRVQIHELRVQIYKLRVHIHEFCVQVYELRVQIHEFKNHLINENSSLKSFGNSWDKPFVQFPVKIECFNFPQCE